VRRGARPGRRRTAILDAALALFSHQGYRGTSIRDIAAKAGVSTGNVYHHFRDKEDIFETLLSQYGAAVERPDFPLNRALAAAPFPDNLEQLAAAAEESIRRYRPYVALIYVDVVELSGDHIRKFYAGMPGRVAALLRTEAGGENRVSRLRPGVSPITAAMLAARFFLHYFAVELLFGVPDQFGPATPLVLREVADILRRGLLRIPGAADPGAASPRLDG
jgi:AcrR family transcriptional regulator